LALVRALRAGEQPYCCCRAPDRTLHFRVVATPEYGVLELDDFVARPLRPWPAEDPRGELPSRAAKAQAPRGWLYLPRDWRKWTPGTPAVVLGEDEMNQLEGEARVRDYGPTVDDGTLLSIVVGAQDQLGVESPQGLVEALVYYVRFDCFLPEIGAPDPPELTEARRREDRKFYDSLGAERPAVRCRFPGCASGAVGQSVFCRKHHFEQVVGRPCPFNDI
jgi:hypothetical protein